MVTGAGRSSMVLVSHAITVPTRVHGAELGWAELGWAELGWAELGWRTLARLGRVVLFGAHSRNADETRGTRTGNGAQLRSCKLSQRGRRPSTMQACERARES